MSERQRRDWTPAEWRDFSRRCQVARDDLRALVHDLPETPGITSPIVNKAIASYNGIVDAMVRLESVLVEQHPELDNSAIRIIHGAGGTVWFAPCGGRIRRGAPILDREGWTVLGARIKALREAVIGFGMELQWTRGARKTIVRRFFKAGDMSMLRCRLDSIVCGQHPDWPEATRVFYGPRRPALASASN